MKQTCRIAKFLDPAGTCEKSARAFPDVCMPLSWNHESRIQVHILVYSVQLGGSVLLQGGPAPWHYQSLPRHPGSLLRCLEGPREAPALCAALCKLRAAHAWDAKSVQHGPHPLQGLLLANHCSEPRHPLLLQTHRLSAGTLNALHQQATMLSLSTLSGKMQVRA